MAINKNKMGLQGNVGNLQFRQVNGQEIVSEKATIRKNPRTKKQMAHRVKWMNISAMYRAARGALYNAFEGKSGNVNDYTLFTQANLCLKTEVYLTKEEKEKNACVVAPYQISKGLLPSIQTQLSNDQLLTDIKLEDFTITPTTTVSDLAGIIQKYNPTDFWEDDYLSVILYTQEWNDSFNIPTATCEKESIKLDLYDASLLGAHFTLVTFTNQDGFLSISGLSGNYGIALVHSRKRADKTVAISSQQLMVKNDWLDTYGSVEQQNKSMISYGVKEDGFLSPATTTKKSRRNEGF